MDNLISAIDLLDNLHKIVKKDVKEVIVPDYIEKVIKEFDRIEIGEYNSDVEAECAICYEAIKKNTPVPILGCNHKYHTHCLFKNILSDNSKCPTCRAAIIDLPEIELPKIDNISHIKSHLSSLLYSGGMRAPSPAVMIRELAQLLQSAGMRMDTREILITNHNPYEF